MSEKKQKLEYVVKKDIKPIVDNSLHKFLGVSIDELNRDITTKLERSPLIDFDIDTNIPFKRAKKNFKKEYLKRLLQINYGNISEVARIAEVDRRSIHRIVKEANIDVGNIRREMAKAYVIRQDAIGNIIENVLDNYKEVIHPGKLNNLYESVNEVSKDILDHLPPKPMTLKEAEHEFEKEFIRAALLDNDLNVSKTAKNIHIRYETLHRKAKKLGLI